MSGESDKACDAATISQRAPDRTEHSLSSAGGCVAVSSKAKTNPMVVPMGVTRSIVSLTGPISVRGGTGHTHVVWTWDGTL